MRRAARLTAVTLGVAVALPAVSLLPSAGGAPGDRGAPVGAPVVAAAAGTRLAFTDERDAVYQQSVSFLGEPFGTVRSWAPGATGRGPEPVHEGELSDRGGTRVFVSTRGSGDPAAGPPEGEVYHQSGDGAPQRVTCDPAIETHPVLGPGGEIAYAAADDADGDGVADTDWDIYVAYPVLDVPARPAPGWARSSPRSDRAGALSDVCPTGGWRTVQVTDDDEYDDLWPTWTHDTVTTDPPVPVPGLAFSRAALDDETTPTVDERSLADLVWARPGDSSAFTGPVVPTNITTTPDVDETQPSAAWLESEDGVRSLLAFTTTELRTDGSVDLLFPEAPDEDIDPWGEQPVPQGSEPVWDDGSATDPALAFTTTQADPYGDIWVAPLSGGATASPALGEPVASVATPGVAESHAAWLDPPPGTELSTVIAFTSRSRPAVDVGSDRVLDADIGSVDALDGADRRVLVSGSVPDAELPVTFDEAGAAYSPDGTRIAFSRSTASGTARVLMTADADGDDVEPLLPPGGREPTDIDSDPVWSPDGQRVAFVRTDDAGTGVWVYDLGSAAPVRVSREAGDGVEAVDRHPTWSPDGEWIMVGRSVATGSTFDFGEDAGRRQPGVGETLGPSLWILDPDDPAAGPWALDTCADLCDVEGRSPSWSPLGDTVAYVDRGTLFVVAVGPGPGDFGWPADDPVAVTGFRFDEEREALVPTPSRYLLGSAEDPAWSPDGSEIAFAGQPTGQPDNRGLYAVAPDGTGLRLVADGRGPETEPAYGPTATVGADVRVDVTVSGSPALVGQPVLASFTVTNAGPAPAAAVALEASYAAGAVRTVVAPLPSGCQPNGRRCVFPLLGVGETRTHRVWIRHDTPGARTVRGTVTTTTPEAATGDNTDQATYRFRRAAVGDLQVRVRVDHPVGYVGGHRTVTVAVRNLGPDPVHDVVLGLDRPTAYLQRSFLGPACLDPLISCPLGTLGAGERVVRDLLLRAVAPRERLRIVARATSSTAERSLRNNTAVARLDVLQPELHVLPGVARPGQAVLAFGEDMPPGTEITIDWRKQSPSGALLADPVLVGPGPHRVAADGTVRIPLHLVRRDFLGERVLTATSTTAEFTDVEAGLLVVPRSVGPPQFVERG